MTKRGSKELPTRLWLVVKERESQLWQTVGQTKWQSSLEYPRPFASRRKRVSRQERWVIPHPEDVSPFIDAHKIIEAKTAQEAEEKAACQTP